MNIQSYSACPIDLRFICAHSDQLLLPKNGGYRKRHSTNSEGIPVRQTEPSVDDLTWANEQPLLD